MRALSTAALCCLVSATSADSVEKDGYMAMPGGWEVHSSCIHHFEGDFHVAAAKEGQQHDIVTQKGAVTHNEPCPFKPRRTISNLTAAPSPPLGYYSDWSVYAKDVDRSGYSFMSSTWSVPAKPKTHGPAGLSSIYFFNGLEDGGGVHGAASLILQPVLQVGKSGCVLNPLMWSNWHLVAYMVSGAGRAYCGTKLSMEEGDELTAVMNMTADKQWDIKAVRNKDGAISKYSTTLGVDVDAAYLTVEAMILYKCSAYPPGNGTLFTQNILKDKAGRKVTPSWTPEVRHSECNQQVKIQGSDVVLQYDAAA